MNPKARALLKGLLTQSGHADELIDFLPREEREEIAQLPTPASFNPEALFSTSAWFEPIHFSWFSQTLKDYPPTLQALFLGILPQEHVSGIHTLQTVSVQEKPPSDFLRPFLMDMLRKAVEDPELLDKQQLPASPLNILLNLPRKQLLQLIDFLGLYDLATDMRQIVDKDLLKKIHQALRPDQAQFLQYCSQQPVKWVSARLGLNAWDGSKKQLDHLLHHRGLIRLAKAIYTEDSSFKWHLIHQLDTGRAKIIQKELYQKQDPALATYFKNQVLQVAKRYTPS